MIAKYCPEYSFNKPSTLVAVSGSGNVAQVCPFAFLLGLLR
jgi:glutamate dehydrogenase (NADP+)